MSTSKGISTSMSTAGKALLAAGYVAMVVSQKFGPEIIEALHGAEARAKATAPIYDDVRPDAPLHELCQGYEDHHFNSLSNCSHAAGMILVFLTICCALRFMRLDVLMTVPPIWYLYAWVGHFFLQQDIPAVFVYGMTLRGWLGGEYCSFISLVSGRTVYGQPECAITLALVLTHAYLLPPIRNWGVWLEQERSAEEKKNL